MPLTLHLQNLKNRGLLLPCIKYILPPALSDLYLDCLHVCKHCCFAVVTSSQCESHCSAPQVTESRRQFAARALQQCLRSKHGQTQHLCQALMIVEASEVLDSAQGPELQASRVPTNAARARSTAAGLLGEQSGNYSLYAALGCVLGLIGQHKVHTTPLHSGL